MSAVVARRTVRVPRDFRRDLRAHVTIALRVFGARLTRWGDTRAGLVATGDGVHGETFICIAQR